MAKRAYENLYPSVTEALGCLRKIGLEMWYKVNTAAFCDAKSKAGREAGTDIHALIEKNINAQELKIDTKYPEEVQFAVKSFFLFKQEHPEIKLKLSEIPGTSEKYGFNFTTDCVMEHNGAEVLGDWKSSEAKDKEKPRIYEESFAQVAAYVKGYNEIKGTDIQEAIIVCFAKDKVAYNIEYLNAADIEEYFNEMFMPALTVCKFQKRKKAEAKLW